MRAKATSLPELKVSSNRNTAARNSPERESAEVNRPGSSAGPAPTCIRPVGARYWRSPTVDNGSRRAAAVNHTSGSAVTILRRTPDAGGARTLVAVPELGSCAARRPDRELAVGRGSGGRARPEWRHRHGGRVLMLPSVSSRRRPVQAHRARSPLPGALRRTTSSARRQPRRPVAGGRWRRGRRPPCSLVTNTLVTLALAC